MSELLRPWPADEGAARAATAFARHFGHSPAAIYSAPGRVNLIGEHTDYNGGLCLPIALEHRTFVALSPLKSDAVELASGAAPPWQGDLSQVVPVAKSPLPGTAGSQPGGKTEAFTLQAVSHAAAAERLPEKTRPASTAVQPSGMGAAAPLPEGWGRYVAGVAWALAQRGLAVGGFRGQVESCVPFGAGLSSSAALECAFALGLNQLSGEPWPDSAASRELMAQACVDAENIIVGAATGGMDQAAALLARPGHALLLDFGAGGQSTQVPFDLAAAGLVLLVIDTRASHQLHDGQFASRRHQGSAAARALGVKALGELGIGQMEAALARLDDPLLVRRTRHIVSENERVCQTVAALERADLAQVGALLSASHASMRDDFEISCPELDLAVEAAQATGALGARMTGGGFGGSAIALLPASLVDQATAAVDRAFADAGFVAPVFLLATAGGPAQRVAGKRA
ncbi:MAG: galactokinase [Micrococcales bacterium]|nr:galactokinase [Micrococcales bacterium]